MAAGGERAAYLKMRAVAHRFRGQLIILDRVAEPARAPEVEALILAKLTLGIFSRMPPARAGRR
jgi:hypothetical protein